MTHTDPQPQTGVRLTTRLLLVLLAVATALPALIAGASASARAGTTKAVIPAATSTAAGTTAAPGQCMSVAVTQQFGNGVIPAAALCSIRGTNGEMLRTDAARAFNRMTAAYAKRFGTAICVSDSYRSLVDQKKLFKARPKLAAKPGTSNHGWGVAVDLCGGAERYSTKKYRWLAENGQTYGFSNPFWARRGGGREEPWHWEFSDGTVASRLHR